MIITGKILLTAITTALITIVVASSAQAEAPVKLLVESQYGAKVNLTEAGKGPLLEDLCTVASGDTCQPGEISTLPGGFGEFSPHYVAVNNYLASPSSYGNIYVTDLYNNRVQELTPAGEFVLMFGKDVNETTGADICTELEVKAGAKCKTGVRSTEAGGFDFPEALAVDPTNGNVYVIDTQNSRVDEFTETGQFVLMIGKEVNQTKTAEVKEPGDPHGITGAEENLCTAASGNVCTAGVVEAVGSNEHGAFGTGFGGEGNGGDLGVGGPKDLLYVGEEHGVQEFNASSGMWVSELSLESISSEPEAFVRQIALDQENGDLYLEYYFAGPLSKTIFGFDATGKNIAEIVLSPREPGTLVTLEGLALDSSGRLAVIEEEEPEFYSGSGKERQYFGSLVDTSTGRRVTGFTLLSGGGFLGRATPSLAFNAGTVGAGDEEFYAASYSRHEIVGYVPKEVAELVTGPGVCKEDGEQETSVVFECELKGQANPENVAKTESVFRWSNTEEGLAGLETYETQRQPIDTGGSLLPVASGPIEGLRPNETIHYELAGYDEFVELPERLSGEELSFVTPLATPRIVGAPSVSFVKPFSAVLAGEVNPENASTEYFFEYAPEEELKDCPLGMRHENCPGVESTIGARSSVYGKLATTLEATGLQPATVYHYRLTAESENAAKSQKKSSFEDASPENEGSFTTGPEPVPAALTGVASMVGVSGATVSGSVNPDGEPATYRFELGVYDGSSTRYATVFSGEAGASSAPIPEQLALVGLQPGTTYAYQLVVQSSYGTANGGTATFTTAGLPEALSVPSVLAQLPVPDILFPKAVGPTTSKTVKHTAKRHKSAKKRKSKPRKGKK